MKYRIKDPKKRELAKELLSIENFGSNSPITEVQIALLVGGFIRAQTSFETEQIKELAEGWHPYPDEEPKEVAQFLVARKRDASSANDFGVASWGGQFFFPVDSNIFAWREMPKVWKE